MAEVGSKEGPQTEAIEAGEESDGEFINQEIDATYHCVASIGVGCHERRGGDSNPRWLLRHAGFQDRCIRPLCHLSGFSFMYFEARTSDLSGSRLGIGKCLLSISTTLQETYRGVPCDTSFGFGCHTVSVSRNVMV